MPLGATPIGPIVGNLTADPEVRQAGNATVASFSIAVTERTKQGDDWVDGATTFWRCSAWRELGEHVAATLTKGMRVIATGTVSERTYEVNGEERKSMDVTVEEIGPSLRYATANVERVQRGQQQGGRPPGGQSRQAQPAQQQRQQPAAQQQWSPPGAYDDETPF